MRSTLIRSCSSRISSLRSNVSVGTELIRRTLGAEADAYALTCPLITKADGKKFGKTEQGNVWLDRRYTTPYKFYQFWLNVGDEEAERYIKIFTSLEHDEIEALIAEHRADPGLPRQQDLSRQNCIPGFPLRLNGYGVSI